VPSGSLHASLSGSRHNATNAVQCVRHGMHRPLQHGMWAHPRDRSSDYRSLDYWVELAQLLERGLFDGCFWPMCSGSTMSMPVARCLAAQRRAGAADRSDAGDPGNGACDKHLGFGVTCNLAYEVPYLLARRMSSLDHLTNGRIGWNIVTGYLDSAARAMGV